MTTPTTLRHSKTHREKAAKLKADKWWAYRISTPFDPARSPRAFTLPAGAIVDGKRPDLYGIGFIIEVRASGTILMDEHCRVLSQVPCRPPARSNTTYRDLSGVDRAGLKDKAFSALGNTPKRWPAFTPTGGWRGE